MDATANDVPPPFKVSGWVTEMNTVNWISQRRTPTGPALTVRLIEVSGSSRVEVTWHHSKKLKLNPFARNTSLPETCAKLQNLDHCNKKSGIISSFCNQTLITSKRSRPASWSKSVTVYALRTGATLQNIKKIASYCHVEHVHFEGQGSNFCKPEFFQPFFSQLHKLRLKLRWLIFTFIQAHSY